jgi:hypothetical protein
MRGGKPKFERIQKKMLSPNVKAGSLTLATVEWPDVQSELAGS